LLDEAVSVSFIELARDGLLSHKKNPSTFSNMGRTSEITILALNMLVGEVLLVNVPSNLGSKSTLINDHSDGILGIDGNVR
jgi:hypothetical protein